MSQALDEKKKLLMKDQRILLMRFPMIINRLSVRVTEEAGFVAGKRYCEKRR